MRSPVGQPAIHEAFNSWGFRVSINGLCRNTTGMPPFFFGGVKKSTSGEQLIDFILEAVQQGFLLAGDILVMDNCPTHTEVEGNLRGYLHMVGVELLFLPKCVQL